MILFLYVTLLYFQIKTRSLSITLDSPVILHGKFSSILQRSADLQSTVSDVSSF
jgi:hypothetical protein